MKILHVTPSYEPAWHLGGVVRSVSQLCGGLAALGHEVTVFTTDSGGDQRMEVPVNRPVEVGGVEVWYFRTEISLRYYYSPDLRKACLQRIKDFDLLHLTSFWGYPEIPAVSEAGRRRVPYVVSTRGTFLKYSMSQKAWKKWPYYCLVEKGILQRAQAIHYTAALEREGMAYLGLRPPSFVIPNGLNLAEFSTLPDAASARKALGLSPDAAVVLFLGRLHARKGLDLLIQAYARVVPDFPMMILILAGPDGGREGKLKKSAEHLGVANRVLFPGYVPPEKRNLYLRAADLSVLATHPGENFGNAAVEAMLAGVPVLVSEHVGICREVAADGAGVVVPLKVEAIAEALKRMLSDPEGLREMGRRAAESARRRYDIRVVAQMMATAYEDILTGRRSPGLGWSDA
jgi:glycosyltransferase involved in cell wall biosynthesis